MTSRDPDSRLTETLRGAASASSADTPDSPSAASPPRRESGASTAPASGGARDASAPGSSGAGSPGARDGHPDVAAESSRQPSEASTDDASAGLDQLALVTAERDQYLALAQRTQADFENFRKRTARESRLAETRGAIKLAKELLPTLDNLERALAAADADDPLLEGVRHVYDAQVAALARAGIEGFSPLGEVFDPAQHEAVAHQPVDGAPPGTVAEVYQSGYRHGDAVIRPARVVVAA